MLLLLYLKGESGGVEDYQQTEGAMLIIYSQNHFYHGNKK